MGLKTFLIHDKRSPESNKSISDHQAEVSRRLLFYRFGSMDFPHPNSNLVSFPIIPIEDLFKHRSCFTIWNVPSGLKKYSCLPWIKAILDHCHCALPTILRGKELYSAENLKIVDQLLFFN